MLEAFQASEDQSRAASAESAPRATRQPMEPAPPRGPAWSGLGRGPGDPDSTPGLTLPMGPLPFLILQGTLLALVFLMGYFAGAGGSDGAVRAGGGGDPLVGAPDGGFRLEAPGPEPSPVLPAREDPEARRRLGAVLSAADEAWMDPANRFTVLVFSAEDTPFGEERTWASYEHLGALGFPVVTPRRGGQPNMIRLFVGAAPSTEDLRKLNQLVSQAPGPDGPNRPFLDAILDNIETYR